MCLYPIGWVICLIDSIDNGRRAPITKTYKRRIDEHYRNYWTIFLMQINGVRCLGRIFDWSVVHFIGLTSQHPFEMKSKTGEWQRQSYPSSTLVQESKYNFPLQSSMPLPHSSISVFCFIFRSEAKKNNIIHFRSNRTVPEHLLATTDTEFRLTYDKQCSNICY